MKSFPWRFAAYFLAAVYLFADLYACHGPLRKHLLSGRLEPAGPGGGSIAEVYGRPVTMLEFREALRAHLWRRGESWNALGEEARKQTRWLVAETLINDRIVQAFRIMNGLNRAPDAALPAQEFDGWSRQFETAADREARLARQHLSAGDMQSRIDEAQQSGAWIDEKIAHRMADITEAQARQWFDEHRESLRIPALYRAAHVYLTRHDAGKPDRQAEIRELHASLQRGDLRFEALAAEFSEDERSKAIGGDLGWFSAQSMPPDFIAAIEPMKPGQTSGPVLTKLGWHLIKLLDRRPSRLPGFEETRDEILAFLKSQRRETAVKTLIAELRHRSIHPTRFVFYRPERIESALPAD